MWQQRNHPVKVSAFWTIKENLVVLSAVGAKATKKMTIPWY
jgi:hypothetical protein